MAVIQVQIGKNIIEGVLLDGGFGINIITKQLRLRLSIGIIKTITITKHLGGEVRRPKVLLCYNY